MRSKGFQRVPEVSSWKFQEVHPPHVSQGALVINYTVKANPQNTIAAATWTIWRPTKSYVAVAELNKIRNLFSDLLRYGIWHLYHVSHDFRGFQLRHWTFQTLSIQPISDIACHIPHSGVENDWQPQTPKTIFAHKSISWSFTTSFPPKSSQCHFAPGRASVGHACWHHFLCHWRLWRSNKICGMNWGATKHDWWFVRDYVAVAHRI